MNPILVLMTQYRHQNDPIYNLDHPQHTPLPLHLVAPIHHPFAFILKSSKPGTSISSAPQQEYTASQFSKHQRMTTQYLPGHFILVDFNLVPKRQELCLVKLVLWKTTFHTPSEMKTENKKHIYKPCKQNYGLFPHTLAQSPDSCLSILFWYQPRLRSKAPWGPSTGLQ